MTETTAKKGMVHYKNGLSKTDFDFGFLKDINYDDKRTLKEVVETLFNLGKGYEKEIEAMKMKLDFVEKENLELKNEVKKLSDDINDLTGGSL